MEGRRRKRREGSTARKLRQSPHQPTGSWIRSDKRLAIYLRDRFTCLVCLRDLHHAPAHEVTLDHIRPRVDGGDNDESNLYTSCKSCNCSRSDQRLKQVVPSATFQRILRATRQPITPYRTLAKAMIAGTLGRAPAA